MRSDKLKKFLTQLKDIGFNSVPSTLAAVSSDSGGAAPVRSNPTEAGAVTPKAPRPSNGVKKTNAATRDKDRLMEKLRLEYKDCVMCPLGKSRTKLVFGEGSTSAKLMFIGEGPGFDEDHTGRPFIGRAGKLLTKIIEDGMKIKRENVYITNIVKCHPMKDPTHPDNRGNDRPPTPGEVNACIKILLKQIDIIRPSVICTLGSPASKIMLSTDRGISSLRGKIFEIKPLPSDPSYTVKLVPTFHPAYLLRNPPAKKPAWDDIRVVMGLLGN